MTTSKGRNIPGIKHVKGASKIPTVKVDDFGGIAQDWSQIDLIDPVDSNLVVQSGIAEHVSEKPFNYVNTKHQVTFILGGEVTVQDLDTGEVFKGSPGDLFYWGPGIRIRMAGKFRALYTRTPVVWRWTRTPDGKKKVLDLFKVENDIRYPGSPADAISKDPIKGV